MKKGNTELRDKIQNALYELKEEEKLAEISEKWFGKRYGNCKIIGGKKSEYRRNMECN